MRVWLSFGAHMQGMSVYAVQLLWLSWLCGFNPVNSPLFTCTLCSMSPLCWVSSQQVYKWYAKTCCCLFSLSVGTAKVCTTARTPGKYVARRRRMQYLLGWSRSRAFCCVVTSGSFVRPPTLSTSKYKPAKFCRFMFCLVQPFYSHLITQCQTC